MSGRPTQSLYPVKDGLGKNLQEVFIMSKTTEFHFDRDAEDIAFIFRAFELSWGGATSSKV